MTRLYPQDDFLARIRILSPAEGGRRTPVVNGIRWDFAYAEDGEKPQLSAIWPDFCDSSGNSLASDAPLPTGTALLARMWIVFAAMRVYHRTRLHTARLRFLLPRRRAPRRRRAGYPPDRSANLTRLQKSLVWLKHQPTHDIP